MDLGCGRAELSLRLLGDDATARGVGINLDPVSVARARTNADTRHLSDRVRLECADATVWSGHVDIAIAIGASHAWGGTRPALDAFRPLLRPGGRLLLGDGIWETPPTPAALAALDAEPEEFTTVADAPDASQVRRRSTLAAQAGFTDTDASWASRTSRSECDDTASRSRYSCDFGSCCTTSTGRSASASPGRAIGPTFFASGPCRYELNPRFE